MVADIKFARQKTMMKICGCTSNYGTETVLVMEQGQHQGGSEVAKVCAQYVLAIPAIGWSWSCCMRWPITVMGCHMAHSHLKVLYYRYFKNSFWPNCMPLGSRFVTTPYNLIVHGKLSRALCLPIGMGNDLSARGVYKIIQKFNRMGTREMDPLVLCIVPSPMEFSFGTYQRYYNGPVNYKSNYQNWHITLLLNIARHFLKIKAFFF